MIVWLVAQVWYLPRRVLVLCLRMYQFFFSPDHSFWAKAIYPHGYCKFYPSCSSYGITVIKKRGVVFGTVKAAWRVLRCNPWSAGGIDEPT